MSSDAFPEPEFQDFFSPFVDYKTYTLPDKLQTITFKVMSEGDRQRYQQKTSRPIQLDRKTDMANIRPDMAEDRKFLIETSVTDWYLMSKGPDGWKPVVFTAANLRNWIQVANPKIIDALVDEIQKANPWMQADMTVEDIRSEISRLEDLLDAKVREETEKNS